MTHILRNWVAVLLMVVCVTIVGLATYLALPRESFPDVDVPVVLVTTPYIGVAPEDVESLITIPIENELSDLNDVKKMGSTSAEGVSIISLEFEPEVVIEDALQRVRDRVNRARSDLPEDAEDTDIREVSFSDVPIMIVTIFGDTDEEELKRLGERLEEEAGRIDGVLEAVLTGGRTRQIRVQVDPNRLSHYGFGLGDVTSAIQDENVNIPGGDVAAGDANFLVRVPGEFEDPQELEGVAIKRAGGRPVFIRDVARVVDGFEDRESYARVNGQPAVTVAIKKRSGANILEIADSVKALVAEHAATWPEGVEWRVVGDQSGDIADMVSELQNGVILALVLVVLVILFFMGARNSLFVAFAIPLSMLMAIVFIGIFGMTLNMMVLFSLILGLGMLVDNGIVIVENIYRHVEEGKSLFNASVTGVGEVGWAVAASTATTVAAFAPMIFWPGIMGQFMGYLPKTVVIVLVCSLFVAIVVLPVLTSLVMRRSETAKPPTERGGAMHLYRRVLELSIDHRYLSMGLGVVSLIVTIVIFSFFNHGTEFFPDVEPDRAIISIRAPDGTDIEATDRIVRQVEAAVAQEENVDLWVAESGVAGGGDPMAGAQAAANAARITVDFLPHPTKADEGERARFEDPRLTISRIREAVKDIPGAEIEVEKVREGPPVGPPIAVEITGESFHEVGSVAAQLRRQIAANVEGVTGLSDDYRVGRPEMRLRIDRGAAKRVGASTQGVAYTVRTAVNGSEASVFRDGEDEYDIVVEVAPEFRDDLQAVMNLRIPGKEDTSPDTFPVPLSAVARYDLAGGSGAIRHVDQDLVVTISGEIVEGVNENEVRQAVAAFIGEVDKPEGIFANIAGAQDEQQEAAEFLTRAFFIAIFLILICLVLMFGRADEAETEPVGFLATMYSIGERFLGVGLTIAIIFATVILSLIGVFWGLMLTGTPFGVIMTGIGVISLAGVVVNNAIVLLDYVEQLRHTVKDTREVLIQAGMTRFRPVVLTALTTMLGLVPMAIGLSLDFTGGAAQLFTALSGGDADFSKVVALGTQSAQWWGPMAVAIIFGLAFATLLTLVLVPTMYSIRGDMLQVTRRLGRWLFEPKASKAATEPSDEPSGEPLDQPAE